jgi:hypothetical protein
MAILENRTALRMRIDARIYPVLRQLQVLFRASASLCGQILLSNFFCELVYEELNAKFKPMRFGPLTICYLNGQDNAGAWTVQVQNKRMTQIFNLDC